MMGGWEFFFAGAGVTVAALGVFLGVPQWRMARRQLHSDQVAEHNNELLQAARTVLMGDKPIPARSPENPSVVDLLTDMRDLLAEQAELAAIVAHHISDGHGGEIPPWFIKRGRG